jgi:hypothetical protein
MFMLRGDVGGGDCGAKLMKYHVIYCSLLHDVENKFSTRLYLMRSVSARLHFTRVMKDDAL